MIRQPIDPARSRSRRLARPAIAALPAIAGLLLALACSAAPSEDARSWWSHIQVLAADSLRGRMTGTADYVTAARYVAERFREQGVKPGGSPNAADADGAYFQRVPGATSSGVVVTALTTSCPP